MEHVLIVDDSAFSRGIIRRLLQEESSTKITEADNGKVALDKLQDNQFDVIFLDLTMPEMDGYDFLRAIQGFKLKSKIFIISADVQPEARKLCLELGATGFMPKPIKEDKFKRFLNNFGLLM